MKQNRVIWIVLATERNNLSNIYSGWQSQQFPGKMSYKFNLKNGKTVNGTSGIVVDCLHHNSIMYVKCDSSTKA